LSSAARPPEEEGDIIRTALCLRAMKTYGAPGRAPEWAARISKARHWLETAKPITAEDRDMQLLGMAWAGADAKSLRPLVAAILAQQRPTANGPKEKDPPATPTAPASPYMR
jgi:hypothetical protein